jgi:hypothetical protein
VLIPDLPAVIGALKSWRAHWGQVTQISAAAG